jgi:hypothetical protein
MFEQMNKEEQEQFEYESTIRDMVFFVNQRGWDTVLSDLIQARHGLKKFKDELIASNSPF